MLPLLTQILPHAVQVRAASPTIRSTELFLVSVSRPQTSGQLEIPAIWVMKEVVGDR
jgi:hypothetical protein